METLKWLDLAVSKDKLRPQIGSIYRDKTALVATDGSRLHLQTKLPESTTSYLDNRNEEFPQYEIAMPSYEKRTHRLTVGNHIVKWLPNLKRAVVFLKHLDRETPFLMRVNERGVSLEYSDADGTNLKIIAPFQLESGEDIEIKINGKYLLDALQVADGSTEIYLHGDLAPIEFRSGDLTAIVMPMKK